MSTLDGSILNVALPTIAADLNASIETVAWVVLAYSLTLVSLMMIFGAWTEHKGYLFAYRFGYTLFVLGSLGCVLSTGIEFLIAGRVLQGVGSAMLQAVGPGMVTTVFPAEERGKGIGLMVMMVSAGLMSGPVLGGFLLKFFPWQSIFVINLPIGLVGFLLAGRFFRLLPKPNVTRPMYLGGGVALAVALMAGTLGLSMLSDYPATDVRVWGSELIALVGLAAFIRLEADSKRAMIGLDIFKIRAFAAALVAAVLMFVAMAGALILIPFYLELVKGFEPSRVGLYLIILPALMFIVAPLAGRISDRIGSRWPATVGMATFAFGLYLLSRLDTGTDNLYIVLCLVVIGVGVAIFNTPNSSSMMGAVGPSKRATASSIIGTSRNIGGTIGVALATALFAAFQGRLAVGIVDPAELFIAAYEPVAYIAAGIAVVALPFCLLRK